MITILPYEASHAGALTDIERISFPDPWGAESLLRTLGGGNTLTLVALEDKGGIQEPVGYVCALLAGVEAEILKLAVLPAAREQGVGFKLVTGMIGQVGKIGEAQKMFIEVRESNRAARILYEKCRFRYMGRRSSYYDNPREDAVLMSLKLKK